MINIDPETGDASGVALKVLAGYRRERANILFGQFLALEPLSAPATIPPPVLATADAGGRSKGSETSAGIGTGAISGGGWNAAVGSETGSNSSENGGDENNSSPAAQAPAAGEVVNSAGRLAGLGSERAGKTGMAPLPPTVGGWELFVSEGMEVAGEV